MTQNRAAPAYQEYAASVLADKRFRLATLVERGLWWTLKLESWANEIVPSDPATLAAFLGLSQEDVITALPAIMHAFSESDGWLSCPELEDYRQHLENRKQRQSEGGKTGAAITNDKKKGRKPRVDAGSQGNPTSTPASKPRGTQRGQVESLVQQSTEQNSTDKRSNQGVDLTTPAWAEEESIAEEF